jgi:cellulose synthase/poly-beta-1,6-N-acetylglucosamine synthase-like glycosyltransferase
VIVEAAFGKDERVQLLTLENGGKARALNRGLELATSEIVVALDADTQFEPDTIARLARWFAADEQLGAVAGNAKVGNRINIVTKWQALEYITAQNLERRALARLGAMTVVPGAVGAWRKRAIVEVGGYPPETLAEDQDLTIAIQRAGWSVTYDQSAIAWTEAPQTAGVLVRQRFRWTFGTLQSFWKHRDTLFRRKYGTLGWIALPNIAIFQVLLPPRLARSSTRAGHQLSSAPFFRSRSMVTRAMSGDLHRVAFSGSYLRQSTSLPD